MNLRTFKHFLIYSRIFKALNFCFQIQGHLRTFKFCTNPDTPYSVAQRGGGNCPGPQTDMAPKSTIETKGTINVIDAKASESRGRAPGQARDYALRAPNPLGSSTMTRCFIKISGPQTSPGSRYFVPPAPPPSPALIDAVRCGGGGVGPQLKILRGASKIIWAAVYTCGNNSYSASMSSEMKTLACLHAIKPCLRNSDHEWKISICCQLPNIISSHVCT